jgi:hypothetical protein
VANNLILMLLICAVGAMNTVTAVVGTVAFHEQLLGFGCWRWASG